MRVHNVWVEEARNDINDIVAYLYLNDSHRIKRVTREGPLFSLKQSPAYVPQYTRTPKRIAPLFLPYFCDATPHIFYSFEEATKFLQPYLKKNSEK